MSNELNILQKHGAFHLEKDELKKFKVNSMNVDGTYNISYLDGGKETVNLENRNDWKYMYTKQEFIDEMIQSIFKYTKDNPINSYYVLYERKHLPLRIIFEGSVITVIFSIGDFDKYHQILFGIDNTIEDVFSLDGVIDFENNLKISHDYCTLEFVIPEHYIEWAFVE